MSEVDAVKHGLDATIALKILYTLHGIESQRYIVKPSDPVNVRVFRELALGVVDIKPCLAAIREASPDFASICDTHSDEYAVYSADFAEEGLPLQSHGKISQNNTVKATGKLGVSKLMHEQLELLIHLLPVRKPNELIAEYQQKLKSDSSLSSNGEFMSNNGRNMLPFPPPPPSLVNSPFIPGLPAHLQLPHSLASTPALKSDGILPSSPPVRAKPNKIASMGSQSQQGANGLSHNFTSSSSMASMSDDASNTDKMIQAISNDALNSNIHGNSAPSALNRYPPLRRASPDTSATKKRKTTSPKNEPVAQCGNCGVADASTWRRARCPDGKGELLCNACGLYYRAKKVMRPRFLWDKGRSRTNQESMNASVNIGLAAHNALTAANAELNSSTSSSSSSTSSTLESSNRDMGLPQHSNNNINLNNSSDASSDPLGSAALWSRKQGSEFISPGTTDISGRLVDNDKPLRNIQGLNETRNSAFNLPEPSQHIHNNQPTTDQLQQPEHVADQQFLPMPTTPQRKTNLVPLEPDSMQKWLGLSTPEQRFALMIPGSGSAKKWLDKAMNPTNFDDLWNSPTPKNSKPSIPDLGMFTSSPPTSSSNMLSEVAEWNLTAVSPGTPQILKFYKSDEDSHSENANKEGNDMKSKPKDEPLDNKEKASS